MKVQNNGDLESIVFENIKIKYLPFPVEDPHEFIEAGRHCSGEGGSYDYVKYTTLVTPKFLENGTFSIKLLENSKHCDFIHGVKFPDDLGEIAILFNTGKTKESLVICKDDNFFTSIFNFTKAINYEAARNILKKYPDADIELLFSYSNQQLNKTKTTFQVGLLKGKFSATIPKETKEICCRYNQQFQVISGRDISKIMQTYDHMCHKYYSAGEYNIYFSNGYLYESYYTDSHGRMQGEYSRYLNNGDLTEQGNYCNDKLEGEYWQHQSVTGQNNHTIRYYKDGILQTRLNINPVCNDDIKNKIPVPAQDPLPDPVCISDDSRNTKSVVKKEQVVENSTLPQEEVEVNEQTHTDCTPKTKYVRGINYRVLGQMPNYALLDQSSSARKDLLMYDEDSDENPYPGVVSDNDSNSGYCTTTDIAEGKGLTLTPSDNETKRVSPKHINNMYDKDNIPELKKLGESIPPIGICLRPLQKNR